MKKAIGRIDWILFLSTLPIVVMGILAMGSFSGDNSLINRQIIWLIVSVGIFFLLAQVEIKMLNKTNILIWIFGIALFFLALIFAFGTISKGAQSRFDLGSLHFQPTEVVKVILILILAKYFSRRHVQIAHFKHIFISAVYLFIPFILVFLQPDFGSAVILGLIWFGMILVSGVSKKHLFAVIGVGLVAFLSLWFFVFQNYQKERIISFVDPLSDIQGAGYNAYQSTIAVGSGQIFGKGVGFGTQSRLSFLPEYETDFIFAAYAEEWGFVGSLILFILFGVIIWRIIWHAVHAGSNFELLYCLGVAIFFISHILINIGMNIGVLPVTGITLPFMSYGGSHLIAEFGALGLLMATRPYMRATHRDYMKNEFVGLE